METPQPPDAPEPSEPSQLPEPTRPAEPPQAPPAPQHEHPIRLVVNDDLQRTRLTVFFRLILAIPLFLWAFVWGVIALLAAIVNWFATLITGRSPDGLHTFLNTVLEYVISMKIE